MISWFKTLPIYLNVGRFRFAHACWDPKNVAILGDGGAATSTQIVYMTTSPRGRTTTMRPRWF
jgi:hypothetical protein